MKRKLISILLTAALVVGLLPATALAAEGETPAPVVYVGGVGLAAGQYYVNCATEAVTEKPAIWNAELAYTNGTDDTGGYTLTINNLSVTGVADQYSSAAIYSTADLTIVLQGANGLAGANTTSENAASAGIYTVGDLTITGAGALSTVGGEATGANSNSYGIYAGGSVNITGVTASPTVKVTGGGAGCSYGIYAEGGTAAHTVHIENATISATGGAADGTSSAGTSAGIRGGPANGGSSAIYITGDNTIVNATGGTSTGGAVADSYGLFGGTTGNITIAGGTVVATGVTGSSGESCGIDTNGSALTVTGEDTVLVARTATVTATSGTVTRKAIDGALDLGDTAKIAGATSDGTSMVTSPSADNVGDYISLAIVPSGWTDTLPTTVNNTVTLTGNTYIVNAAAYALSFDASTTIKTGDYTLLAVSLFEGNAATIGIYADYALTIEGNGSVIAIGGTASVGDDDLASTLGVNADGYIKNNATLVAISGPEVKSNLGSYGIYCSVLTNGDENSAAALTAIGGSDALLDSRGQGIFCDEVTNYAVLTAIGGHYGVNGSPTIKNEKNATLTAVGIGSGVSSGGLENRGVLSATSVDGFGVDVYGDVTNEKDAILTATAGAAGNGYIYGVYISGGDLTNNGVISATVGAAGSERSCGVYSSGTITNDAGATLVATAGPASKRSYGVYSTGTITNNEGATLVATAGDATGTSAISAGVYGDITSSGALTATGGAATGEGATSYGMYHTGAATGWLTSGTFQGDTAAIQCTGTDVTLTSLLASDKVGYADKDTKLVTGEENLKVAKYLKVLTLHTVTFNANGHGTAPKSQTVPYGGYATEPTDPTVEGYRFDGWYTSASLDEAYDFSDPVTKDLNLYAKWTQVHTVTFDYKGLGGENSTQTVDHNGKATEPDPAPTATGYNFGGWYTSASLDEAYDFSDPVTADLTLYAKWTQVHTVTFDYRGLGGENSTQTVDHNGKATEPDPAPTATGYDFGGWYTSADNGTTLSATEYDFDTPVTADLDLYAKWTIKSYTVTFNANGHGTAPEQQTVNHGDTVADPGNLTAEGYTFGGWYTSTDGGTTLSATEYDFDTPVTADLTLYAKWTIKSYTVTFDYKGLGGENSTQTVDHNEKANKPTAPTVEGYRLVGWYTNASFDEEYDFSDPVTADLTLYAKWTQVHTVTFDYKGLGGENSTQTVDHNEKATKPTAPTVEGYRLVGWYTNASFDEEYDFSDPVTADLTLYAKWTIKSYTVTFDANGHGDAPESQTVNHGDTVADPGNLTAEGYTFGGWYWDAGFAEGSKANFPYTVEDDVTFYALWTEADDGGSDPDDGGSSPDDGGSSPDDGGSSPDDGGSDPDDGGNDPDDGGSSPDDGGSSPDDGGNDPDDGGSSPDDGGNSPDDGGNDPDNAEKPACPQDETCPIAAFGDVDSAAWYHEGLHYCIERGLMIGISDTEFMPHGLTTRGTIVTILYRLEGKPEVTTTGTFSDVADGLWYTEAVEWAAANGIVEGDGENFYPEANLTREQMATILHRYAQYKGVDVTVAEDAGNLDFTDADQVSEWADLALQWACAAGLYEGDDNGLLRPGADLERCEMATLIFRLCENILK